MLDGLMLIDAHLHPARLPTLKPAWLDWARRYGQPGWERVYDDGGTVIPQAFDDLMESEGVDHALLLCEYSPKVTGIQPAEELLPIVKQNPARFAFLANVNPHLHYPVAGELARQLALGAVGLKVHPVHAGVSAADPMLYPAYQACAEAGLPVVVHCGTSSFPGSDNSLAAPDHLLPVLRDFPGLTVVLAHGGRGWWYDAAASLALLHENVWIEPASSSSRPTGPACPASPATLAPSPRSGSATTCWPRCWPGTPGPSTRGWARSANMLQMLDVTPARC